MRKYNVGKERSQLNQSICCIQSNSVLFVQKSFSYMSPFVKKSCSIVSLSLTVTDKCKIENLVTIITSVTT